MAPTQHDYTDGAGLKWRSLSFQTSDTFTVPAEAYGKDIEYILVAGGGGGGDGTMGHNGGGGGGGGVLRGTIAAGSVLPGAALPVVIGLGGAPRTNGGNSSFNGQTAIGGGHGGSGTAGAAGGSGGGGGSPDGHPGGPGTPGQGFGGGTSYGMSTGGGGGGATAAATSRPGGAGLTSTLTGASVEYGAGASGGASATGTGIPGALPGKGGSGARDTGNTTGSGAHGILVMRWSMDVAIITPPASGTGQYAMVGGAWVEISEAHAMVGGAWKGLAEGWARQAGAWVKLWPQAASQVVAPTFNGGLISNGGFSTPDVSEWGTGIAGGAISYDPAVGHTSPGSVLLTASADNQSLNLHEVPVVAGQTATWDVWVRHDALPSRPTAAFDPTHWGVQLAFTDAAGTTLATQPKIPGPAVTVNGWVHWVGTYVVPAGAVSMRFRLMIGHVGKMWLDEARVTVQ